MAESHISKRQRSNVKYRVNDIFSALECEQAAIQRGQGAESYLDRMKTGTESERALCTSYGASEMAGLLYLALQPHPFDALKYVQLDWVDDDTVKHTAQYVSTVAAGPELFKVSDKSRYLLATAVKHGVDPGCGCGPG